jgi:hypothetical protein
MGCGSSKSAPTSTEWSSKPSLSVRPQTRPLTCQTRTARRPATSCRPRPRSVTRQAKSGSRSTRDTPHHDQYRPYFAIFQEEPRNVEIIQTISTLSAIIDQHSQNFYSSNSAFTVCREIGQSIVDKVFRHDSNGTCRLALLDLCADSSPK